MLSKKIVLLVLGLVVALLIAGTIDAEACKTNVQFC